MTWVVDGFEIAPFAAAAGLEVLVGKLGSGCPIGPACSAPTLAPSVAQEPTYSPSFLVLLERCDLVSFDERLKLGIRIFPKFVVKS